MKRILKGRKYSKVKRKKQETDKKIQRGYKERKGNPTVFIKDQNMLGEDNKIGERWNEYFNEILNENFEEVREEEEEKEEWIE